MNYTKEQLKFIGERIPELALAKVPSKEDDPRLIEMPSLDQIIIEFLKQHEVYIEPRSVGQFNGWDVLSALSLLTGIYRANNNQNTVNAIQGGGLNIASGIFFSNRSNQINNQAQEWNTWKRWALSQPDFTQYKDQIKQSIELNNKKVINEVEKKIKQAEEHNKNILKKLRDPSTQDEYKEVFEQLAIKDLEDIKEIRMLSNFFYFLGLPIAFLMFFLSFSNIVDNLPETKEDNLINLERN